MPITAPAVGDPTKQTLIQSIIDALAAAEVDIASIVGERLVTNGSFEVDSDSDGFPDQWTRTLYAGGSFSLVSDTGTGANSGHGLKAIKFVHPGGGGNGGGEIVTHADTYIEASPRRSYWLSWLNKNSVATVTNSVEVLEYDATLTLLATTVIFSETSNPTSWKKLEAYFTLSDVLTRYIKIKFKCGETSASTACDIYIDNVQLTTAKQKEVVFANAGIAQWICPTNVRLIEIDLIGAGGGGGGTDTAGTGGGGGGGGGHVFAQLIVTPATVYDIVIGAGGAGGGTTVSGSAGGNSTIIIGGTTYTGAGGSGGTRGSSGGAGGAGGAATNGDMNYAGIAGGTGDATDSGAGGYPARFTQMAQPAIGANGNNGPAAGCGGSGGDGGAASGGTGQAGILTIRW